MHPGSFSHKKYIKSKLFTIKELAKKVHMKESLLYDILLGRSSLKAEHAYSFERSNLKEAIFLLKMQDDFNLLKAREKVKKLNLEILPVIKNKIPQYPISISDENFLLKFPIKISTPIPYPGQILKIKYFEENNIFPMKAALRLMISNDSMIKIFKNKIKISPLTSVKLELAGIETAKFWLTLSSAYSLQEIKNLEKKL